MQGRIDSSILDHLAEQRHNYRISISFCMGDSKLYHSSKNSMS